MLHKITLFLLFITVSLTALALDIDNPVDRYKLRNQKLAELADAKTADDSIRLLYDAFDLASRRANAKIGWQLLETARRANNNYVVNDALRLIANRYLENDSIQHVVMQMAVQLPDNELKRETITFIKMLSTWSNARKMSEKDRQIKLQQMLSAFSNNQPRNLYDEIYLLHSVCVYLSQSVRNDLLVNYLDKLISKSDELPESASSLKSLCYNMASIHYIDGGDYNGALAFSKKLIAVIDTLESRYAAQGRKYRNLNDSRFTRYATMMFSYPGMTDKEVDEIYEKAKYYAVRDSDALETFTRYESPTINYLMAKKRYREVIPIIKRQYDNPFNIKRRKMYTQYLIEAASGVNDDETLIFALKEYQTLLENYVKYRSFDRYRELQIIYDVSDLKLKIDTLEKELETTGKQKNKLTMFTIVAIACALIIIVILLLRSNIETSRLRTLLSQTDAELNAERQKTQTLHDKLIKANEEADRANRQKSDFINNMSNDVKVPLQAINEYSRLLVDCIEGEKKGYLERFSNLIELNCELLTALINDVLNLSELDSSTIHLTCHGANVAKLCQITADSVRNRLQPGVRIDVDIKDPSMIASTDPKRVEQVLISLLSNAAKFTEKGSVTLSCHADAERNLTVFTVTDTGIGIAPEKKDVIFDRFVKLSRSTPGAGIGLTVARMIARLLGGDVVLDTTYTKGARFIFTIATS